MWEDKAQGGLDPHQSSAVFEQAGSQVGCEVAFLHWLVGVMHPLQL